MPKLVKGDPSKFCHIHSVAKDQEIEGGPLKTSKCIEKSLTMLKKALRGTVKSDPVLYNLIKKGTTFIVQFCGTDGPI